MANGTTAKELDAVVVGAGFAGMYMLHKLREFGFTARVIEAGKGVGGTWYWNRYPGARCDVESLDYQYSFSDELQREWTWTERYATQPEILRYANYVADKFKLWPDMQFETRVTAAVFDEAQNRWQVSTDRGEAYSAQFLITAVGCLSASRVPDFKGLETFEGTWYHTGQWPHEGVDFTGLRVGVVGTGSSGIQSIPLIAQQAKHVKVFQRTPNFSLPANNEKLSQDKVEQYRTNFAEIKQKARESAAGIPIQVNEQSALQVAEEERQKAFEAGWEQGGFHLIQSYIDLAVVPAANETVAEFVRAEDPCRGQGPGDRGGACTAGPPARHEAHLHRFQLLRDLQPRQRDPGQSSQDADRRDHSEGHSHLGGRVRSRRDRVRDGLRRDDGRAVEHGHPGARRCAAQRGVVGGAADVPRAAGGGLPEHVHDHRPREPLGALQHDRVHRAARGMDRGLHGAPAGRARRRPSSRTSRRRMPGWHT